MMNWFYKKIERANVENFTSDFGLWFRRINHKMFSFMSRFVHEKIVKYKIVVDRKYKLEKNKSYIFASNHYFYFDVLSIISSVDRNCYILSAELKTVPNMFLLAAWLNGGIYVSRSDKNSRRDSVLKMGRVLKSGNSILIFPEGKWNNSESKLCLKLFSGVYNLSFQNNVEVVPVSVYKDSINKKIYVNYGEPIKLYQYVKEDGLTFLRDTIATLFYEQIEKYSTVLCRSEINGDIRYNYMKERMLQYSGNGWKVTPNWEEELFELKNKENEVDLEDVWKDIDKVKLTKDNIVIFAEILVELEKRKKYNLKNYIIQNFEKKN